MAKNNRLQIRMKPETLNFLRHLSDDRITLSGLGRYLIRGYFIQMLAENEDYPVRVQLLGKPIDEVIEIFYGWWVAQSDNPQGYSVVKAGTEYHVHCNGKELFRKGSPL